MIAVSSARLAALADQTDNPFAAWLNLAKTATLGGTSTLPDGSAANAVTGTTFDYWLPNVTTTTATFRVTFGAARTLSCVAIAAHNLGSLGATVSVERSTDGGTTWTGGGAGAVSPADNSPIIWRMVTSGQDAADWRIKVSGITAGAPVQIGVCFFGDDLVFPMRFYKGFAPVISPTEVQLQSNVSAGGNLLGTSIIRKGSTLQAAFRNIDPGFVRGVMAPFIPYYNAGGGYFFGWRPATYPQDAHYCWKEGDALRPVNSDTLNQMTFTLGMRAFEP